MKRRVKGVLLMGLVVGVILGLGILLVNLRTGQKEKYEIVVTNFPAYDFARAIVGAKQVKMLVPPGTEMHGFEPTTGDLEATYEAKLFVYNGGESESWVEKILNDEVMTLKMMDVTTLLTEEISHHDGEEAEYNEHVWTSPENAKMVVEAIARKMGEIDADRAEEYLERAEEYNAKIDNVVTELRELIEMAEKNEEFVLRPLIFGDRFPFLYFVEEYGLEYAAAFPGCSHETEVSPVAIMELINLMEETDSQVVLKMELSDDKIAKTIAEETGAKVLTLHSAQTISQADFESGKTYIEILRDNLEVLKEVFGVLGGRNGIN